MSKIKKFYLPLKRVFSVFYKVAIGILMVIAIVTAASVLTFPNGLRIFVVQSGSMHPALPVGSVVIVSPDEKYVKGEVITFKTEQYRYARNPKETITHRIVEVTKNANGDIRYVTKGDANKVSDQDTVKDYLIIGKVRFSIPYLGFAVSFAKTLHGLIILVIIPATLIVYSELMNIKDEAKRLIIERRTRKLTAMEKVEEKTGEEVMAAESWVKKLKKRLFGKRK